jgi:alpha-pyrone synthase
MKSFITAIGTANPSYCIPGKQAAEWMAASLDMNARERKALDSLYELSGINTRYTVIADYTKQASEFDFFKGPGKPGPPPGVQQRMELYKKEALPLALKSIKKCFESAAGFTKPEQVTHLILVSCTGMYAPGLDIEIIEKLGLPGSTQRTSILFMGCYAAFNAMKSASYICMAEPDAKVLIVCIELCTIHFQNIKSRDNLVSNALFGDGAAAMLVEGKPAAKVNISLESFHCALNSEGKKEMAWVIGDNGFEMTLSSYIPGMIKGGIKFMAEELLSKLDMSLDNIDHFAIHPGGRKILEVCEEELGLSKDENAHAYKVLREYGNMSSPTVLFVLNSILKSLTANDSGKNILSFAFGPGLTMEAMLGKVVIA